MFVISRTIGLCSAYISKHSLRGSVCRGILTAARKVFCEIPDRGETRQCDPDSLVSYVGRSSYMNLEKGGEDVSDRELAYTSGGCDTSESFYQMNGVGRKPTKYSLCTALNTCAKTLNLRLGKQIHAHIVQIGYEDNLFLNSALVDLYAKCDAIMEARSVFCCMTRHDQVSWSSIIAGFSQNGYCIEAIVMFKEMLSTDFKPNSFTYVSVISACTGLTGALEEVSLLHTHVIKLGFNSNSFVVSSLIDCYSKWGMVDQASLLFGETTKRDNILFNSIISGYSQNLYGEEAMKLFMEMRNKHLSPTDHTLTSILNASGSLTVLQHGRQIHSLVTKMGSESNVFVVSALIDMYSKCGSIDCARCVFDQTVEKNSVLWTSMIMGYAQSGRGFEALELFEHSVTKDRFMPDHVCFTAVLTACNHAGFLERGIEYFNKLRMVYGLVPELDQYACLVDLYARNGHLRKAKELMEEMPYTPNYVMWSSFLSSCKVHGEVDLAREAAHKLIELEPCNAAHYVTLSHIYARAGLWAEVAEVRKLMQQKAKRKSAGWSWLEVDKAVHVFSVGDIAHPCSGDIYGELEKLNMEMKETNCMLIEIENIGEE
ncbi:hypothetical protein FNV43_RR17412 [Rhamnella rubrinervis]|uniref:Pentatricopeptide repeat-containing protein n=1 Tax=Rhamnella rubrinervis TaxID=2594499 RepID=A0A8K0GRW3_9ROSA|nr:hypothetical protein FNV43_RR17412 [Rhamnella rubrinervis]